MSLNKFTVQKSFAISAGAGSGKTYTLSRRYINALLGFDYFRECYKTQESHIDNLKPAKVNQIVTITYTEAAALEMKGRIFGLISKIIKPNLSEDDGDFQSIQEADTHITKEQQSYVQQTLQQAYTDSSNTKISTIHSYCLDIIKSNADIARIDTKLDIIKDDEKQKELSSIIFEVLNSESNKGLVLDISKEVTMFFMNSLINKYVSNTKFRNDYDSFNQASIDINMYKKLIHELYPLPDSKTALIELQDDELRLQWFEDFYDNFLNFNAVSWNELDTSMKAPGMGAKKFPLSDAIKKELEKLSSVYSHIDEKRESIFFHKIDKIRELLRQIKNKYDDKLSELNKIDFDTIISKTLEIISKIQTNFKYIMVDEFQDTNAIQYEIVKKSCNPDTNLFVVGDSKQSIYSFQGAEIEVFNTATSDKKIFSSIEPMDKNHRSDGVILNTVNQVFEKLLTKDKNLQLIKANYEAQAQDLHVFKKEKEKEGSFKYLITSDDKLNEVDNIAKFISEIFNFKFDEYKHISELIAEKEKAIAIVFDSSTKMLELKQKLRERGITAKVSASDNFYHTKEINDIFNVLKAINILVREPENLSSSKKYYVVGAMRSNILRCDDNSIKKYIDANQVSDKLNQYVEIFKVKTLSQTVKYILDDSNVMGVYAHYDDVEQREANLNKFLLLCQDYENSNESNLYKFLSLIENAIYFSEAKEDEAFFKSDNTKSIEICSIHSTKGLAYPLVLLGNSDKGLYSQITSDALKHNNFTLKDEKKEIVGFKVGDYTPLSHRVLKEIDKRKHLAEKKRLLYVALTRAEHDVIISAKLKQKRDGTIFLRKDSYLYMIIESLGIEKEIYGNNEKYCIQLEETEELNAGKNSVEYVEHSLKKIEFHTQGLISATTTNKQVSTNTTAAKIGTITHKIIELYWDSFKDNQEVILNKMMVFETKYREEIVENLNAFYASDIYSLLQGGVKHHFELEFTFDNKTGFIDFIYFDNKKNGWVIVDFKTGKETEEKMSKYQEQLNFYKEVIEALGYKVLDTRLLWLN